MTKIGFYVRVGTVYVPLAAKTEAGFYLDIEPVEVAEITNTDSFASALRRTIARGNPVVPTPPRASFPKPAVLKYAKVKSWKQFERESTYWSLSERDGKWRFGPWKRRADRGWEPDPSSEVETEDSKPDNVIQLVVAAVQRGASD